MRRPFVLFVLLCLAVTALLGVAAPASAASQPLQFSVSFAPGVHATPLDGRLLVIVSPTDADEPRLQADAGWTYATPPFWGLDVDGMQPGTPVTVGSAGVDGYPLASIDDLEPGWYYVQAVLNVYTTFHRSDGSVVKLHLPGGDGNDPFISPGNLVSTPGWMYLDPGAGGTYDLRLDQVLAPLEMVPPGGTTQQGNPLDSEHVKHVKIKSRLLSEFWGRPMYIGANVLLPEGYNSAANRDLRYPVVWEQGHFTTANPWGFDEGLGDAFSQWWVSKSAARVIYVTIRHENPYFDDSYAVNSANLGPYGDAITKELMPAIAGRFRTIDARWASATGGGSTGGWEAAAQMILHPRLYSGAWMFFPDPLDFHCLELVDIYNDTSAHFIGDPSLGVLQPAQRDASGAVVLTMEQESLWELALGGSHGRSGLGEWDVYQAAYGPQGADGYPAPIWDKRTGLIDHSVADAWRAYDLDSYLQQHWATVGHKVAGRMFFYCGLADDFYYNDPLQLFEANTATLTDPSADFSFRYYPHRGHGWLPYTPQQLITLIARYMARQAPDGTDVSGWIK